MQRRDRLYMLFLTSLHPSRYCDVNLNSPFGLIVASLNLSTAVFSQRLVDKIIPEGNRQQLVTGLLLLAAVLLIKSFEAFPQGYSTLPTGYTCYRMVLPHLLKKTRQVMPSMV